MNEALSSKDDCDCVIETTHGLPCTCRLESMERDGVELKPYHLHHFWRSLEYRLPVDSEKWEDHDSTDRAILSGMVQTICDRGGPAVRALTSLVRSQYQPESDGVKQPKKSDAPKGRPRARKTDGRHPSYHEHASAHCTPPKGKTKSGFIHVTLFIKYRIYARFLT